MKVYIHGAGNTGTALARELRRVGWPVAIRAARRGLPRRIAADLIILAVRDADVGTIAALMAATRIVPAKAVVVHVAGQLGAEELAPLRGVCRGVAQMHPMLAFANRSKGPPFAGAQMTVSGDAPAVRAARVLAKALGMVPRSLRPLDRTAYHAAAGLMAAGTVGLAHAATEVLVAAGVRKRLAGKILAPLLRSVANNLESLGLPGALTGVVRRGDAARFEAQVKTLRRVAPELVPLYLEAVRAQIPLARALGEGSVAGLDRIEALVSPPKPPPSHLANPAGARTV
jgi:predicted short-subunit dehydrogenase-like oxidoreductase (DUF2520 family)